MEVFILMVGVCACDLEADEDEVGGGWQVVVEGESGSERITIPVHSSYYMYEPRKNRSKPNASDHPIEVLSPTDRGNSPGPLVHRL